jgi:DNA-binding NarL/FixJ family response regulator
MRAENTVAKVARPSQVGDGARYWSRPAIAERGLVRRHPGESINTGCSRGAHRVDAEESVQTTLLIVDDYALYRDGLAGVLAARDEVVAGVAWDVESVGVAFELHTPDVVLVNMASRHGLSLLRAVFAHHRAARVIALGISDDDERQIVDCAEAGVAGYHLRSDSLDDLVELIARVSDGEPSCCPRVAAVLLRRLSTLASQRQPADKAMVITAREDEILGLLDMGLSNQQIASRLCIAIHTVKNHVHSVLTKLDARSRSEAVARYRAMRDPRYARMS